MQDNWQWCNRCMGLSFFGDGELGSCPAGDVHSHSGSGNYALAQIDDGAPGQNGWRWCLRCQGLYFIGNNSHGSCPSGGAHQDARSGDYVLHSGGDGQDGWRWCVRCQGLWYAANGTGGVCPAPGGGTHSAEGSGDYVLTILAEPAAPPAVSNVLIERTGDRALVVNWVPTASGAPPTETYEVFESTGPFADRLVETVSGDTHHLSVSVWGDLFPNDVHCFTVYAMSAYGRSDGVRACSPPLPEDASFDDVPHDRGEVHVSLSGTWQAEITPPSPDDGVWVELFSPRRTAVYPLPFEFAGPVSWRGSLIAPSDEDPAGEWMARVHVRGIFTGSGADTGDLASPLIPFFWDTADVVVGTMLNATGVEQVTWAEPIVLCSYFWDGHRP